MNWAMVDFAIEQLKRRFWKNIAIFLVLTLLIWLVASVLFISASVKSELFKTIDALPEIFVQKMVAGRVEPIEIERIEKIEEIVGVEAAYPRVWGYYYFAPAGVNFSVVGIDFDDISYKKNFNELIATKELGSDEMIVGEGVKRILERHYYKDFFNFITPQGEFLKVSLAGVFDADSALESSDTIVVSIDLARKIFMLPPALATDIVVKVPNRQELPTIAQKIKNLYPDTRVITKADIHTSYQNIFDYKSGLFLALFLGAFVAFFILVFEKASSVGKEQKKEIAILKALGWRIVDILRLKFIETLLVVGSAYMVGMIGAYFFVFVLQAPLLRDLFSGFSILKPSFRLLPVWDWGVASMIFFIVVPLYLAATLIPNWRASVTDPEEALR